MSATARETAIRHWHLRNGHKPRNGMDYCEGCAWEIDDLLKALDAAGFAIVPKEPTEAMLRAYYACMIGTHPKAAMNPDKYLVHNLKARKRWFAMLAASTEPPND